MKTNEICPYCGREHSYNIKKMVVRCKSCNKQIILCSMCKSQDCTNCKHEKQIKNI